MKCEGYALAQQSHHASAATVREDLYWDPVRDFADGSNAMLKD